MPLLDTEAERSLGFMTFEERVASSHLVTPEGFVYSGVHGMLAGLAAALPPALPLLWIYRGVPGVAWALEDAYRWFAANRYRFGGGCRVG